VRDLETIAAYIADDSPAYASIVVRNIVGRVKTLAEFSKSGRKVPEFDDERVRDWWFTVTGSPTKRSGNMSWLGRLYTGGAAWIRPTAF